MISFPIYSPLSYFFPTSFSFVVIIDEGGRVGGIDMNERVDGGSNHLEERLRRIQSTFKSLRTPL